MIEVRCGDLVTQIESSCSITWSLRDVILIKKYFIKKVKMKSQQKEQRAHRKLTSFNSQIEVKIRQHHQTHQVSSAKQYDVQVCLSLNLATLKFMGKNAFYGSTVQPLDRTLSQTFSTFGRKWHKVVIIMFVTFERM